MSIYPVQFERSLNIQKKGLQRIMYKRATERLKMLEGVSLIAHTTDVLKKASPPNFIAHSRVL